jgi:hypothetical protein
MMTDIEKKKELVFLTIIVPFFVMWLLLVMAGMVEHPGTGFLDRCFTGALQAGMIDCVVGPVLYYRSVFKQEEQAKQLRERVSEKIETCENNWNESFHL